MKISDWFSQNWIILTCLCILVFSVISGIRTGSAIFTYKRYRRSEDPGLYWTAIVASGLGAVGLLLVLIFR